LSVRVTAENISDLRARLNTTLRSIQAASESLIEVNRSR
jgi:tRNA threonylcarbamoyladenosine modification (KEOPS) complex  Pcc1 subunit